MHKYEYIDVEILCATELQIQQEDARETQHPASEVMMIPNHKRKQVEGYGPGKSHTLIQEAPADVRKRGEDQATHQAESDLIDSKHNEEHEEHLQ